MLSKKLFPFVAGAALLAAPVVALAGHRDGNLKSAEAEGVGKQGIDPYTGVGAYFGTLRASDGDRAGLKHAWFVYEYTDAVSATGSIVASGETCYLASFTLNIHRDNDSSGQGGNLHLKGSGLDCSAGGYGNGQSIQNFVYYVAQDGDGCYSYWKRGMGTGNLTSDTLYSGNDPKTVIHLDGNLLLNQRTD